MSCGESFFGQGSEVMSKEYACKFQGCAIFVPGVFFQKEDHSTMMDRHFSSPKSFLSRPFLRIICCCYGFMACPCDLMAIQLLAAQKKLATCHSRLGVAPCTIRMSTSMLAVNPCVLRQKLLCVISRALFLCDSSLLTVERINKNLSFFQSQIKLQPLFFSYAKNESIQRTGSYKKSSSKSLLLVAVALYNVLHFVCSH